MKLLQLNMWMGRLGRQIVPLIEREQPDIITAQEIFSTDAVILFPNQMFDCAQLVQAAGGYEYVYFSSTWSVDISHELAHFGNAIFSRYPMTAKDSFFTHGQYVTDLNDDNKLNKTNNAQFVTLDIDGRQVHIINHHGHWEIDPAGNDTSVARMTLVRDRIADLDGQVLFAGDFNVNPGTPTMQLFDGMMEDLTATHGLTNTLSELGKVDNVACDHILVSPEVHVRSFDALDDIVSDHKALVLEFDV